MTEEEKENTKTKKTRSGVSRREFIAGTVGGVVVGAVVGAAAGSLGFPKTVTQTSTTTQTTTSTTTAQPWLPAKWDYTADVVIIGTGHAGLSTAITAYDAGANVLILEKMPQGLEGGNSRCSGNMLWAPLDAAKGVAYIKAMSQGQVQDETVFTTLAQGLMENLTVIQGLGGKPVTLSAAPTAAEWPELPGAETVQTYNMAATTPTTYGPLYKVFRDAVASRNIKIMYSTPATGLIQNSNTKEILGVTAATGGTVSSIGIPTGGSTINIKANKAVVLACGGFEFNPFMVKQYIPFWPFYGFGTPSNTGDGVAMAYAAGADLWHFNSPAGGAPGILLTSDPSSPWIRVDAGGIKNTIWVDKQGHRYVNEQSPTNHGWKQKEYSTMFSGANGAFLAIPTWAIFDETIRLKGPLTTATSGWNFHNSVVPSRGVAGHTWSSDNSAEVAKGWITKADTIAGLAVAIAADPDNANPLGTPFMDPTGAALQATITRYNGFCAGKADLDFGRPASTLFPLSTPPYYAMKVWPGGQNTQGGPKRDVGCHVLAPSGKPIPRLYGTGELGSFWGLMYNAGGNNGECLLTGRIAGKNAAAETSWS